MQKSTVLRLYARKFSKVMSNCVAHLKAIALLLILVWAGANPHSLPLLLVHFVLKAAFHFGADTDQVRPSQRPQACPVRQWVYVTVGF